MKIKNNIDFFINILLVMLIFSFIFGMISGFNTIGKDFFLSRPIYIFFSILSFSFVVIISNLIQDKVDICKNKYIIALGIFLFAIILRLLCAFIFNYTPTHDFARYYGMGQGFEVNDYETIRKVIKLYNIPYLGGISIFYGVIFKIFSSTNEVLLLINSIITSLICVVIYSIAYQINKKYSIRAATIYAIYPTAIVGSSVNTNQHGAILLYLSGISIILMYSKSKKITHLIFGSFIFSLGQFMHPSIQPHIIAILIFFIYLKIKCSEKFSTLFKNIIIFSAIVLISINIGVAFMKYKDIIPKEDIPFSYFRKIVFALDPVHKGRWYPEGKFLYEGLSEEEADEKALMLLKEYTKDPKVTAELMLYKYVNMWFVQDNLIHFFIEGVKENFREEHINKIWIFLDTQDMAYIYIYYTLSIPYLIALLKKSKKDEEPLFFILIILLYGWISIHFINELQSRYRYFGITLLVILASGGIDIISSKISTMFDKHKFSAFGNVLKISKKDNKKSK